MVRDERVLIRVQCPSVSFPHPFGAYGAATAEAIKLDRVQFLLALACLRLVPYHDGRDLELLDSFELQML